MQPVEINAGAWYLLPRDTAEWLSDTRYTWAVCEATTGESVRRFAVAMTNQIVGPA